jgi:hypothetical protein
MVCVDDSVAVIAASVWLTKPEPSIDGRKVCAKIALEALTTRQSTATEAQIRRVTSCSLRRGRLILKEKRPHPMGSKPKYEPLLPGVDTSLSAILQTG